jgi:hypothetical protein
VILSRLASLLHRPRRPKNGQADLQALVQNASLQAGHMYRRFRDEGVFVGQEAW